MNLLAQTTTTTSTDNSGAATAAALAALSGTALIAILVFLVIQVVIYFVILKRAGYNPWLSLLTLIGIGHIIIWCILVFAEWPVQRELRAARAQLASMGVAGPPPGTPAYTPAGPTAYGTAIPPPGTPPTTT